VDTLGAWLTVIALLGIGAGLLWLAAGFRGTSLPQWARWLLAAAGVLLLLEFLLAVLSNVGVHALDFAGAVLPPLAGLLLLVAAVMVLVADAAPGAARWVLLLPAVWSFVLSLAALTGPFASWWAVAIGDLLFAAAGGVYLSVARGSRPVAVAGP
jgi:hypothetical protein